MTQSIMPSEEMLSLANSLHDSIVDAFGTLNKIRRKAPGDNVVGGMTVVMLEVLDYSNEIINKSKGENYEETRK